MAEVTQYGYSTIRNFIENTWKYIELQDTTGVQIIRLGTDDSRVNWVHNVGDSVLKLEILLSGSEVFLPITIAKTAIFDVATGGTAIATADVEVTTLTDNNQKVRLTANIQVPTIV